MTSPDLPDRPPATPEAPSPEAPSLSRQALLDASLLGLLLFAGVLGGRHQYHAALQETDRLMRLSTLSISARVHALGDVTSCETTNNQVILTRRGDQQATVPVDAVPEHLACEADPATQRITSVRVSYSGGEHAGLQVTGDRVETLAAGSELLPTDPPNTLSLDAVPATPVGETNAERFQEDLAGRMFGFVLLMGVLSCLTWGVRSALLARFAPAPQPVEPTATPPNPAQPKAPLPAPHVPAWQARSEALGQRLARHALLAGVPALQAELAVLRDSRDLVQSADEDLDPLMDGHLDRLDAALDTLITAEQNERKQRALEELRTPLKRSY